MTTDKTELGNARAFIARHGKEIRFCPTEGQWYVWSGHMWEQDDTCIVDRLYQKFVDDLHDQAVREPLDQTRDAAIRWWKQSASNKGISAAMSLAKKQKQIIVTPDMFDRQDYMLNTESGLINLRTGELIEHDYQPMTKKVNSVYLGDTPCPRWEQFLSEITDNDLSIQDYMQNVLGSCLIGKSVEQAIFFLYGTGANGKSVFIETLSDLLGDYAITTDPSSLMRKNRDAVRNDLYRFKGARLVVGSEASGEQHVDEVMLKQLTGGDTIVARPLYKEFVSFRPTWTIVLRTNRLPQMDTNDNAIWRRVQVIPFNVQIPPDRQDKYLRSKLRAEFPGILAWLVKGCLAWQDGGLKIPDRVAIASTSARAEVDAIGLWERESLFFHKDADAPVSDLLSNFNAWATAYGVDERFKDVRVFARTLKQRYNLSLHNNGKGLILLGVGQKQFFSRWNPKLFSDSDEEEQC